MTEQRFSYEELAKDYLAGDHYKKICEKYRINRSSIYYVLDKLGIKNRREPPKILAKCDDSYFEDINTEEKAYLLGFLYADGCNPRHGTGNHRIALAVHPQDRDIIEKFAKAIKYEGKIIYSKLNTYLKNGQRQEKVWVRVNSKKMSDDLYNLGCVNSKSDKIRLPDISDELIRHFIRGYNDGDGCLGSAKNKRSWHLYIVSNIKFCEDLKKYIESKLDINCQLRPIKNPIYGALVVGGNLQFEQITDWLYKDATIYLDRKYQKYIDSKIDILANKVSLQQFFIDNTCENNRSSKLTNDQVRQIRSIRSEQKLSHRKIAKMFNVHRTTIKYILNGRTWKSLV